MLLIADFSVDIDCGKYLKGGWSIPEPGFVWSCEAVSELFIPQVGVAGTYSFVVEFRPFAPSASPYRLFEVHFNDTPLLQCALSEPREVTFALHHDPHLCGHGVTLSIRHLNPLRPSDFLSYSNDTRLLSLALTRFEMRLVAQTAGQSAPGLAESDNLLCADAARRKKFHTAKFAELARDRDSFAQGRGDGLPTRNHIIRFLNGAAADAFHLRREYAYYILDRVARETGESADLFQFGSFLKLDAVRRFAPRYADLVFESTYRSSDDDEVILAAGTHAGASRRLPPPINKMLMRECRPALSLHSRPGSVAYVWAYGHQIYDSGGRAAVVEASASGLSRSIVLHDSREVDGNVVIVQDRYAGANFSHFLFDFMSRLRHFCAAKPQLVHGSTFVLGGVPGPFQEMVLDAFQRLYAVERRQLFFPGEGLNLLASNKVYWFSDATDAQGTHPAQIMHPDSVALFRDLSNLIEAPQSGYKRLYISRSDVGTRDLTNEDAMMQMLQRHGFQSVTLAALPVQEQLGVVRSAEVIVAPHGMGLTYLALHGGAPLVVELFNPTLASDAYACLAIALGCPYEFVIGTETDPASRGFSVDVESVEAILHHYGIQGV